MKLFRKRKIVLALGGGGARGLVNIGVLKALEKCFGRGRLPFDMIIGSSIGSLIGAAYSAGMSVDAMEKKATQFNWPRLVDLTLSPTGLFKGDKLEDIISDMVGNKDFEDLKIPFALTTTDIQTGRELIHTSGDLVKLVRASCSWPGFFTSVEIDGKSLGDGGLRNAVPTKAAYKLGGTFVVAVNPGFGLTSQKIDNALKALVQSIQIMGEELNTYQTRAADIAIKPLLEDIDQFSFDKADYIIKQGEAAATARAGQLKKKLRWSL